MLRRTKKTVEEKAVAAIRAELSKYSEALARDLAKYRERLRRKREAGAALARAEAEAESLRSERIELKTGFWEAYYEQDEAALSKYRRRYGTLERSTRKAERVLRKARARFEKADFDEVAEGFALKAKANITQEEVDRRVGALEHAIEELSAGTRRGVEETRRAACGEYEEPSYDTDEERDAHLEKTIGILKTVAESYTPGK